MPKQDYAFEETENVDFPVKFSRHLAKFFESLARRASKRGARLVCFPKLALTSYAADTHVIDVAEKVPGPLTDRLGDMAKALGIYISIGMAEKARGKHHIAQVAVGPSGYVGKYRKYYPTPSERDVGFAPGRSFPTFDVDGFRLGINICADGRHADTIEAMRKAKADVVHHPHGNFLWLGKNAEDRPTQGRPARVATAAMGYTQIKESISENRQSWK